MPTHPMPTFGFEAEYHDNVEAAIAHLYQQGHATNDHLHSWHCRCDTCDIDRSRWFHGQTDSSCGGEIISRPFEQLTEARAAFDALSDATVAVDAEPSLSAGFHVHVDASEHTDDDRGLVLLAFRKWEHPLIAMSRGPFASWRGANETLDCTLPVAYYPLDVHNATSTYYVHHDNDRHTNLNVNTGHDTFEFRIWNSTRAPWRMEMHVELSRLFMVCADELIVATQSHDTLLDAILASSYPNKLTLARHVQRQLTYTTPSNLCFTS